jgi:hypothetical protein
MDDSFQIHGRGVSASMQFVPLARPCPPRLFLLSTHVMSYLFFVRHVSWFGPPHLSGAHALARQSIYRRYYGFGVGLLQGPMLPCVFFSS